MKHVGSTAALLVLAVVSLPTAYGASQDNVPAVPADARNCVPPTSPDATRISRSPSKPPLIRVCVADPDAQLTLPWFLTDIINAVNTHQSGGDLLRKMRKDF
ncbi:hypothetical protein [Burkholderia sp. Ac-20353]|uniref:hypothetical protein n=1 Tax=Burkholderia sp. Ac-20353 TaxID=2703894 RepID=UPI00197B266D|nr:hypothetical protein [Burkholderia sp. Ac-20353]MBN3787236.1 hypothetical protein [Burkholderia sp. Ac-20353]